MGHDYICIECGKLTYGKYGDEECDRCYDKLYGSDNEQNNTKDDDNEGDDNESDDNEGDDDEGDDIEDNEDNEENYKADDNNNEQKNLSTIHTHDTKNTSVYDICEKGLEIINSTKMTDEKKLETLTRMFMDHTEQK
jgi:hypothetical protein